MTSETFDADWLALREPVDHRARAEDLAEELSRWWSRGGRSRIVDLGSGTGSNLRYLSPRLDGPQDWTLVDHDPALLALAAARPVARGGRPAEAASQRVRHRTVVADLTERIADRLGAADLITASALLDLVSEEWLAEVARACSHRGAAALFALSYDGVVEWSGAPDPDDRLVIEAVNEHQRTDKGFGPALGPGAARRAAEVFDELGYRTSRTSTPWRITGVDAALATVLVEGWARAAADARPEARERIERWSERRLEGIRRPDFSLTVGHADLLALPPDRPNGESHEPREGLDR